MKMAVFEETRFAPDVRRGGNSIGTRVAALLGAVAAWNDARLTRRALAQLNERQLDDIGLTRGDVERM